MNPLIDTETFMNRISLALNKPIQTQCAELAFLLERASMKDLQQIFPLLLDSIFGPQGTVSWGLRSITSMLKPHDFHVLQHFLSPNGPLFRVIYCLVKDPLIKFDFSITYLPSKIRQLLDAGSVHPFYSDLVHVSPQNKQIVSLQLNAFDYYMFQFAYHLINPYHQRTDLPMGASWNTVYYILCCDYAIHFFPTEPIPVTPPCGGGGKTTTMQATFTQQYPSPSLHQSKLMKKDFFSDPMGEIVALHPPLENNPRAEIWRSESVLTIFLDMWLSNDQVSQPRDNFNISMPKQTLHFNELPTGEYVRIIRALVKQLHAFASSVKMDDGHMSELKKITLPILQPKMYVFLRNLIHRWPLDGSFRLVLELWLSFIQPWRYPGSQRGLSDAQTDVEDLHPSNTKSIDKDFLPFIAENILSYSVIFQQLLPRFLRVDLVSPKNSLMLYRLAKVFDQPNLVAYIREIEDCIVNNNLSPSHSYNIMNSSMPPLSPTSKWSTNNTTYFNGNNSLMNRKSNTLEKDKIVGAKYAAVVRQKIFELEGPGFCYKTLFTTPPAPEVYELLHHIRRAKRVAIGIVEARLEEIRKKTSGFFGFFKQFFMNFETSSDEFSLEDRKKVPSYLDFAFQYICDMFQITELAASEATFTLENTLEETQRSRDDNSIPAMLTPEKVRQRIYAIKYEGDPDLHPIRTHEMTFLVRMFYHWATKMNETYGPFICNIYETDSFLGKISRQLIQPPVTVYRYDKSQFGRSPRIAEHLPPRVSLRYFASYKFLLYIGFGYLIAKMLHYSSITYILFVFSMWACTICFKALFDNKHAQQRPNRLANISFDDSF